MLLLLSALLKIIQACLPQYPLVKSQTLGNTMSAANNPPNEVLGSETK